MAERSQHVADVMQLRDDDILLIATVPVGARPRLQQVLITRHAIAAANSRSSDLVALTPFKLRLGHHAHNKRKTTTSDTNKKKPY